MKGIVCSVCGGSEFQCTPVLWQKLVDEWQLSESERAYVDRQQGERCTKCNSNLRSIALATAIKSALNTHETLAAFFESGGKSGLKILEINEAGDLSKTLRQCPGHEFGAYPEVDMHALPYPDGTFDVVVHSDTLEHVPNPEHALGECRRVTKPGGAVCFTVPAIVGRLSRSRNGLPKSHHGNPAETGDDFAVHTEFGADLWTYPMRAGFSEVRLFSVEYPAALAMAAIRSFSR